MAATASSCAVLIDAGSSGSRIQIYSIDSTDSTSLLPVISRAFHPRLKDWQLSASPGLSSYAHRPPSDVAAALRPLLQFAAETVPVASHATTPVRVLATAGMRLLPLRDQERIIDAVCTVLHEFAFAAHPAGCHATVKVISGEDEGLYGWLALNYLAGRLDAVANEAAQASVHSNTATSADDAAAPVEPVAPVLTADAAAGMTLGFLDMGGASTQIAFAVPVNGSTFPATVPQSFGGHVDLAATEPHPYRTLYLPARPQPHHQRDPASPAALVPPPPLIPLAVHVTTYLGMGTNEARKTHVRMLTYGQPADTSIADPCLPRGLHLSDETGPDHPSGPVTLVGTGDWDLCRTLSDRQLVVEHGGCPGGVPCLVRAAGPRAAAASRDMTFVGVSEYWYSTHDLLGLGGGYVPEHHRAAARAYCSQGWTSPSIASARTAGVAESRLRDQCFKSAWLASIMHTGFGVADAALPPTFDPLMDSICPVTDGDVLGDDHSPHPPPAHVAAGWKVVEYGKGLDVDGLSGPQSCTRPSIKVVTSDHVGDTQIAWPIGYLVAERLPSGPSVTVDESAPPPASTTTASAMDAASDAAASNLISGLAWLLLFAAAAVAATLVLRRVRRHRHHHRLQATDPLYVPLNDTKTAAAVSRGRAARWAAHIAGAAHAIIAGPAVARAAATAAGLAKGHVSSAASSSTASFSSPTSSTTAASWSGPEGLSNGAAAAAPAGAASAFWLFSEREEGGKVNLRGVL
ncbi:nucleoside phosphatase family-domain-containing protein [Blastocladiella britannica]|nr:nucleoside phosphatase family-domain-containing protein [Blastocladiella britannica]